MKVYCLVQHAYKEQDARVLGIYTSRYGAVKARDRASRKTVVDERRCLLDYTGRPHLAIVKKTLKGKI